MAMTGNYKEYERLPRVMTVEDLFNLGMSYVDTPLDEGFAKLLVNFDLKNQGTSLVPRGGLKVVEPDLASMVIEGTHTYAVHHIGTTLVQTIDGQDATVHKYILIAAIITHPVTGKKCYSFNNTYCYIEKEGAFLCATTSVDLYTDVKDKLTTVHGVELGTLDTCSKGIFVSVEANTYIPTYNAANTGRKFMQLVLQFTSTSAFSITMTALDPKEVPASQVINSGYNLMKPDPYTFANAQNATGALVLSGIIPKDANGNIRLTADVGETLVYHLNYTFPAADVAKNYMVQWEVKDTTTSASTQVIQQVRKSPSYLAGADISIPYTIPYKQFTMIVKVYYTTDVTAHTYVSDDDDLKMLTPLKVITVSSYYTTAGTAKNAANLTPKVYDMTTCKGICTWQQRMVLWGVTNATTTLFVSQPNLPEYVPYPNNVEVFSEDIVMCVPYLTFLLVFTTSKLYQLSLANDGISSYYTTKCIQERLIMTPEDASTIQIVKNMVYFKSGNYFYMIVPNNSAGAGELQLAPVSRPVEALLDNFEEAVKAIIEDVYNVANTFNLLEGAEDGYTLSFKDYANYLDGTVMRNVYKCQVDVVKAGVAYATKYLDFALNYDTMLRAWTVYMYENTRYRLIPYESTVTTGITFLAPKPSTTAGTVSLSLLRLDATSPKDEAPLTIEGDARSFVNHQMINTGYRAHFPAYQKRFREVQFSVNNTAQDALQFHTSFIVDDDVRKPLFEYTAQQIVDPESPDYGLIYIERTINDALEVSGATQFGIGDGWTLDFSRFPNLTVSKVRFKVSGKGYLGKVKILSKNEVLYELLGTHWVYRKMNAR